MTSSVLPNNPKAWDSYMQGASGRLSKSFAADSRPYDPNTPSSDYGAKLHPMRTIVVLHTPGTGGTASEYRVGILGRSDLQAGLRCKDGVSLNKPVVKACFAERVYYDESEAFKAAKRNIKGDNWPDGGIKMIQCHEHFPIAAGS